MPIHGASWEPDGDERAARMAAYYARKEQHLAVYDQEMDEPGDLTLGQVIRFRELDERTDGAQVFRMLWDSLSIALPIVIEVFEVEDGAEVCVHRARVEAHEWSEAYAHPWAF